MAYCSKIRLLEVETVRYHFGAEVSWTITGLMVPKCLGSEMSCLDINDQCKSAATAVSFMYINYHQTNNSMKVVHAF